MHWRHAVLLGCALAATLAVLLQAPLAQDPAYHYFADQRALTGIANAGNVLSNAPFLLAGLLGLARLRRTTVNADLARCLAVFFAGVTLTAFGSAWYHAAPDNASLLWDRLPMTLAFTGLFAAVIVEFVSRTAGRRLLLPLLAAGLASVLYWAGTEAAGAGDLRFYLLVQFLPLVLIPLILALYRRPSFLNGALLGMLGLYALAKAAEEFDASLLAASHGLVSGHTLKHLLAATAAWLPARALRRAGPPPSGG